MCKQEDAALGPLAFQRPTNVVSHREVSRVYAILWGSSVFGSERGVQLPGNYGMAVSPVVIGLGSSRKKIDSLTFE